MSLKKNAKNYLNNVGRGFAIVTGREPKPSTPKPSTPKPRPAKARQTVQIENRAKSANQISKQIEQNANSALKINHVGGTVSKPVKTKEKTGSKVFQATMKALDTTGNATRTGYDFFQRGKNPLEGFKKGWKHEVSTSGKDIINNNAILSKGIDTTVDVLSRDKSKVAKRQNAVKGIAGFGLEVGLDPLNYVSFGGKGFAKGLVSGIGGTVGRETAEAGAKVAGKQLLRATAGKGLVKSDDLLRAVANVPEAKKAKVMNSLVKQIQAGGSVGQYSDEVSTLAAKAYDDLASQVAKNSGFTMQNLLNAKSGTGVKIGKRQIVEAGKMRDAGAKVNRALLGDSGLGRRANDRLMELARKGYKAGLKGDDYHLLRMVDTSSRGFSAKGFDRTLEKISGVAKGSTAKDEAVVRRMLEQGADSVQGVTAKQRQMYDTLKNISSDISNREIVTGMLNPAKLRENYLPRVKNTNIPSFTKLPHELGDLSRAKSIAREVNPSLMSARDRKIKTDSVQKANQILSERYKDLKGIKFFEESPTKAFALRAKDHFDKVGSKFKADDIISSVGRQLTVEDLINLSKPRGNIHNVIGQRGDTVVAQKSALSQLPLGNGVTVGDLVALSENTGMPIHNIVKQLGLKGDPYAASQLANRVAYSTDELITNLSPNDYKALASLVQTNLPKGSPIPVHSLPREVIASLLDGTMKRSDDMVSRDLVKGLDKVHNAWKPLKTSLNLNYYPNNLFGGVANTLMDVGAKEAITSLPSTTKLMLGQGDTAIQAGGRRYTKDQLKNLMEAGNVISSNFARADLKTVNRYIDDAVRGGGFLRHPIKTIQDLGSKATDATEQFIRTHEMVGNLRKGLDPISAGERVKMHQFDYGDLSNFEKNVMKRVMPFYTFKSKNMPAQIGKFLDNPLHHYRMLERAPRLLAEHHGVEWDSLPEYLKEQAIAVTGTNEQGMMRYFNPSLPQTDLYSSPLTGKAGSIGYDAFGMVTPALKLPIETGYNMRMLPEGRLRVNDDKNNPAYFMGKTIPKRVENIIDTMSPLPNLKYNNPENLRGRAVQPDPKTLGYIKEFDEVTNSKFDYYNRADELKGIMDAMKKAGVELPPIDKIVGRKGSKKYNPAPKAPYLQGERFSLDPLNPRREDYKTEEQYQKALQMAQIYRQVPEKLPPQNSASWADFITTLIGRGGK